MADGGDSGPMVGTAEHLEALIARAKALGEDERRVVALLLARNIGRLELGRAAYGELRIVRDSRRFKKELAEESDDLANYQAFGLLGEQFHTDAQVTELQDAGRVQREEIIHLKAEAETWRLLAESAERGALLPGWTCRVCGVFNGTAKEDLRKCRACDATKPGSVA